MELTGVTERKKSELEFLWNITEFHWICHKQSQEFQMVHSPEFVTGTEAGKKSTWQMYIVGEDGLMCLILVLRGIEAYDGKTNTTVRCAFGVDVGVVDEKKSGFSTCEMEHTFELGSDEAAAELLSIPIKDLWSKSGKFVHNNALKIRLQLVIISEPISTIIEPKQLLDYNPVFSAQEMQGMGIYPMSDIRIRCGNRIFHVHRSVLCFKSKVLAAMLKSSNGLGDDHAESSFLGAEGLRTVEDNAKKLCLKTVQLVKNFAHATKNPSQRRQSKLQSPTESPASSKPEKLSSTKTTTAPDVLIDDLDPFTLELVLRFMYSGDIHHGLSTKIEDTTKIWSELLYAAGKFELTDLKNAALENILCSKCCRESKNLYPTLKASAPALDS